MTTPIARAWLGRMSEALSVTTQTRAEPDDADKSPVLNEPRQMPERLKSPIVHHRHPTYHRHAYDDRPVKQARLYTLLAIPSMA
jgi:hypothetical protein